MLARLGLIALSLSALLFAAAPTQAGVVRHLLWDANQRPLYQACARDFQAAHPHITVRIQQQGWDTYWTSLSTGFISGTAPDVFTNHLSKFSEFVMNGVVSDLAPLIAREAVGLPRYETGLLELWQRDGRQYALPADWDTVALVVNFSMAQAAGLSRSDLQQLNWNPKDGGSFGRALERLTLDEQGRNATQPGFDARRVKTFGYQTPGPGGMMGQTEWSHFAVSNGWRFQDRPWDPALRYDDPLLIQTLDWVAHLAERGISAKPQALGRLGADALFTSGRVAMVPSGSWMVGHFARHARFEHVWVPLPVGPIGQRASMRNGLAHSLWSGSKNASEAWLWLRHLGSRACQEKVAAAGVVYPAIQGLGAVALQAQRQQGVDAQAFFDAAKGLTYPPPIAGRAAEVTDLMNSTLERILSGRERAAQALPKAAKQVREWTLQP